MELSSHAQRRLNRGGSVVRVEDARQRPQWPERDEFGREFDGQRMRRAEERSVRDTAKLRRERFVELPLDRNVMLRFGVVLSGKGGALPKMLTPFKLGVGGRLGSGQQWMSWIAIEDVVGIIRYAIANEQVSGPVNVVAPSPVRNEEFTRLLAAMLHRPAIFPAPAFVLRLAMGEMADAVLLSSDRVKPERMLAAGYRFRFEVLEPALRAAVLSRM